MIIIIIIENVYTNVYTKMYTNTTYIHTYVVCTTRLMLYVLSPPHPQGHYRLGAALVGLEKYEDAFVSFAQGLAADPKQISLLDALVEAMLKSSYKGVCVYVCVCVCVCVCTCVCEHVIRIPVDLIIL